MTRTVWAAFLVLAPAGCSVTTTHSHRELPARVVLSVRDDPGPIGAITVFLRDGTAIPAARLSADGDRLVVETTDGTLGRIPRERVARIEIRRRSGGLTVLAVAGGSLVSLLFLALLVLL